MRGEIAVEEGEEGADLGRRGGGVVGGDRGQQRALDLEPVAQVSLAEDRGRVAALAALEEARASRWPGAITPDYAGRPRRG
jgi:hypothetical protein